MTTFEARITALERARRRGRVWIAVLLGVAALGWGQMLVGRATPRALAEEMAPEPPAEASPVSYFDTVRTKRVQLVDDDDALVFAIEPATDGKGLAFKDAKGGILVQLGPVNRGGAVAVYNGEGIPATVLTVHQDGRGLIQVLTGAGRLEAIAP